MVRPQRSKLVREPVQVYLSSEDSQLLARLADETGLAKAEILRRGVRSLARELAPSSPMLEFLDEAVQNDAPADVATNHDAVLAAAYMIPSGKPRKSVRKSAR